MSVYKFDLNALIARLAEDDSWEEDPEIRQEVAFGLRMEIVGLG